MDAERVIPTKEQYNSSPFQYTKINRSRVQLILKSLGLLCYITYQFLNS